jgi:hypothetical protein
MKQAAHTWIAIRALELIQRDQKTKGLGQILAPWVKQSYIGCWLPDMPHFKKGHGLTQNHTFKMAPYEDDYPGRFVLGKDELASQIDANSDLREFLENTCSLDEDWWQRPFKAEQPDGHHLADCLSSIYDTIMDLILIGDEEVDDLVPGDVGFADHLDPRVTVSKEQISTFFFMMSHYVADAFMPLHCDKRPLAAYSGKMHKQWEQHWENLVGDYFAKDALHTCEDDSQTVIGKSRDLDDELGLRFKLPITYDQSHDVWKSAVYWCRASFALASQIFPEDKFPYDGDELPKYGTYLKNDNSLPDWDRIVLQTAVYSVAGIWKKIWRKFKA